MNDKVVYEYAVVRIVPRVEREEFINAGVILFSKKKHILLCKTYINTEKLACFDAELNIAMVENNLQSFEKIAFAKAEDSPIAQLDEASRFRWLTAAKSTIIQCSPVHPGITENVEEVFNELFEKLVL